MAQVISGLGRYPDSNGFELKAALSARYGVPAAWITLGNGSNDLLELASLALLGPGAATVYSQPAFAVFRLGTPTRRTAPINGRTGGGWGKRGAVIYVVEGGDSIKK